MPKPFLELTLAEFSELIRQFPWRRSINEVHVHHTWRPNHSHFASRPPVQTIEGMWRFHTQQRGFSDIAQHVTIDPNGKIWTGRNWNAAPASARGFNGNSKVGPFMFEMIGDFDRGGDPWKDPQRGTAIEVIALVQQLFSLEPDAFRLHNEMSPKTCPGSGIDKADILKDVRKAHERLRSKPEPRAVRSRGLASRNATRQLLEMLNASVLPASAPSGDVGELPEEQMRPEEVRRALADPALLAAQDRERAPRELSADDRAFLRRHVINLRMGAFSTGGEFSTSPEDVEALFAEHLPAFLAEKKSQGDKLRLVFFAHGGLNEESEGLKNARHFIPFYLDNGCYPIFFVWETGPKETLVDILRNIIGLGPARELAEARAAERGFFDTVTDFSDAGLEAAFREGGFSMWANMKFSAERAFLPHQGGAFLVEQLTEFWKRNHADMEIHAIGHSAGSIFHAHFLDLLCRQAATPKVDVATLHFLAPAITVDLFKQKLMALVGKQVKRLTEYTMQKDFELDDAVGPYRKSLLYLVSRSFEDRPQMPILGLEESLRHDPDMIRFFGLLANRKGPGEILFSVREDGGLNSTIARHHGDFDNDRLTMGSVMRRILDLGAADEIVEFPDTVARTVLDEVPAPGAGRPATPSLVSSPAAAPAVVTTASGARKALCIGIDRYPPPNQLGGCVNDARDWASALAGLGFETSLIQDGDATWEGMRGHLVRLVSQARAGDVIVLQYSGHGTELDDLDGDEDDQKDSALCPVDFDSGGFLIDDDLREIFGTLAAGVNLTCFFDCCHSGTTTRLVGGGQRIPAGARRRFIQATPAMEEAHRRFRQTRQAAPAASRGPASMLEVSFAACTDSQVALEFSGHGQFTARAVPILAHAAGTMTNQQFYQAVIDAFGSAAARQTPQLDCAPASLTRTLLAPLDGGPVRPAAPPAVPGDAIARIDARLDSIERRLASLGA